MNIREKMHTGKLYMSDDLDLLKEQAKCLKLMNKYNKTSSTQWKKREKLMKKMFAEINGDCYIEPPFRSNWGGRHVHLGKNVYANFNLTLVDDTHIYIGDYTMIGPNVTIATAGHPILPKLREKAYQYNFPVHIGKNCWIGAGVVVLPGITIGDNSVIGAGSIVTKNIPANVVAVGNPCKVLREISNRDEEFYFKDLKIEKEDLMAVEK